VRRRRAREEARRVRAADLSRFDLVHVGLRRAARGRRSGAGDDGRSPAERRDISQVAPIRLVPDRFRAHGSERGARKLASTDLLRGRSWGPSRSQTRRCPWPRRRAFGPQKQAQIVALDPEFKRAPSLISSDVELAPTHATTRSPRPRAYQPNAVVASTLVARPHRLRAPLARSDRRGRGDADGSFIVTVTGPCATNALDDSEPGDDSSTDSSSTDDSCDGLRGSSASRREEDAAAGTDADPNQVASSGHVVSVSSSQSGPRAGRSVGRRERARVGGDRPTVATSPTLLDATKRDRRVHRKGALLHGSGGVR